MRSSQKRLSLDRLVWALLPLAFVGPVFLNMWAFVLDGHRHEWFRQAFVLGVQGIAALCIFAKLCQLFFQKKTLRRPMLLCLTILLAFGAVYLWALLLWGNQTGILKQIVVNGGYLFAACGAGFLIAAESRFSDFLDGCQHYALSLSPVVLYYCIRFYLPSAAYGVEDFGVFSYMSVAYGLLEFCVFLLLRMLLRCAKAPSASISKIDFCLYLLFSVAITLTGTKGTILCLLWGSLIAVVYAAIVRRGIKPFCGYAVSALLSVVLFTTVLAPDYGMENRVLAFLKEGNSVEIDLAEIEEVSQEIQSAKPSDSLPADSTPSAPSAPSTGTPIDSAPSTDTPTPPAEAPSGETPPTEPSENTQVDISGMEDVVSYVLDGDAEQDYLAGRLSEESYQTVQEMARKINNTATGARKYLWSCALKEIRSAPLTGHGPMAYQMKYGTYPHNFFLELAADFGLPIMLAILLLGLWVFLKLIRVSFRQPFVAVFTLYVLAFLPEHMISGSIYGYSVFFQYGFCILLAGILTRSAKIKENSSDTSIAPQ